MQLQKKDNSKLNILFLFPRYHTNQIAITNILQNNGHKVHFHVKFFGKTENYENIQPLLFEESFFSKFLKKIFFLTKDKNTFYLPKIIKYYFYLKKLSINIVIIRIHGRVYSYFLAFILKFFLNSKIIFYEQANSDLSHLKGSSLKIFLKKIEFRIRIKLFSAKWCTPLHKITTNLNQNCYYLPFTVKQKKYVRKLNNKIRILIIGKFQDRKNQILAIKILKNLITKYNLEITIVGELSTKEHEKNFNNINLYINENNLLEKIKLFTNIDHKKMNEFYLKNDIFFLPSYNEPASISILEAMSYGLPSICHISCGTKTYIKKNYNGYVLETLDVNTLEPILKNISNNNHLQVLTNNCIKYYNDNFSEEIFYKYFKKISDI